MLYAGKEKFNIFTRAMFTLKYLFVMVVCVTGGLSINSSSQNETAEILWKLSNIALQSRQIHGNHPYPYSYKYPGKYPQYYQNYLLNGQYPGSTYQNLYHDKPYYKPHTHNPPSKPSFQPFTQNSDVPKQSLMDILFTVARNDDLQCVPKIICEVTSGAISGRQQSLNLPININMESLLGFLSTLSGVQSSPLLYFGKAALQGYASKGNTGSCNYAYPECPSDPDKLVQYLNNHNGGFFRYFNGAIPSKNYHPQHQVPSNFRLRKSVAEQRIQNKPVDYVPSSTREQKGVTFPVGDEELYPNFQSVSTLNGLKFPSEEDSIFSNEVKPNLNEYVFLHSQSSLKFPTEDDFRNYPEQPFRKPKELPYDLQYYHNNNELDLQKPLPNHKAAPIIFPVRTGTGDLRLDAEELESNNQEFYEDDDVRINFNRFNGRVQNYVTNNFGANSNERNGRKVTFPS